MKISNKERTNVTLIINGERVDHSFIHHRKGTVLLGGGQGVLLSRESNNRRCEMSQGNQETDSDGKRGFYEKKGTAKRRNEQRSQEKIDQNADMECDAICI